MAIRDELFYWALEDRKFSLDDLHARKDNLWHAMDFRAAVSMKSSTNQVMSVLPTLSIWRRQRPLRHAGAVRKPAGSQSSIGTAFFNCSGCRDELQDESMSFESSSSLSTQQQCRCFRCSCASSPELLSEVSSPPSKKAATDDHRNIHFITNSPVYSPIISYWKIIMEMLVLEQTLNSAYNRAKNDAIGSTATNIVAVSGLVLLF